MNNKIIVSLILSLAIIPMVFALNNNPTVAPNGECYVEEPIKLYKDWNMISLYWNNGSYPLTGDRIVELVDGLNLIGNSGVNKFKLKDITFTNVTGTYSYADSGLTNIRVLRDKADSDLIVDSDYITNPKVIYPQEGFWITSNSDGNITLPNVGGVEVGETFPWSELRFSNGTDEKNVSDAHSATYDWIDDNKEIAYWDTDNDGFRYVCSSTGIGSPDPDNCLAVSFNSHQGYFVYSNINNLTLIRQNTTETCKIKPRFKGKFITVNKKIKPNFRAKYITVNKKIKPRFRTNHAIRYLGELKNYLRI